MPPFAALRRPRFPARSDSITLGGHIAADLTMQAGGNFN
jgi:hypothetical protein